MIYLIDDDVSVLRAFEIFLESAGMQYRSFTDSDALLSVLKPSDGDLVVMDLSKPDKVALEMLKKFCKNNTYIPVLVITVFEDDDLYEYCRQAGVKAILRKPVDGEVLIDLIKYNLPFKNQEYKNATEQH
ncbi:MAG: response regulator [Bacteroidota bacterium]